MNLLARRFGVGSNRNLIQRQFQDRTQKPDESHIQFLDALEGLRSQGFAEESENTRRYEILQRFMSGVRDERLREYISCQFAQESKLDNPPTVETLRFSVQEYLKLKATAAPRYERQNLPPQQQNYRYNNRGQYNQPDQLLPPADQQVPHHQPFQQQAQAQRQPMQHQQQQERQQPPFKPSVRGCYNCGDNSHFAADCPLRDKARKPVQQANSCRYNPTGPWSCPSYPTGICLLYTSDAADE